MKLKRKMNKLKKIINRRTAYILALILSIALAVALFMVPLPEGIDKEYSTVVRFSDHSIMRIYKTSDDSFRVYTPINELDPRLVKSAVCFEDKYYYYHPGVNALAIARAVLQNIKEHKIVSGGSTLTMQTAKVIDAPRSRTVKAKIIESFRALQLEARYSKKAILELYFNLAPYGGNFYGVNAASLSYFGKPATKLAPAEIAYLVSLPQSPSSRKPGASNLTKALVARNRVLGRMRQCSIISEKEYHEGLDTPVPSRVMPIPMNAPSAADFIQLYASRVEDQESSVKGRGSEVKRRLDDAKSDRSSPIQEELQTSSSVAKSTEMRRATGYLGSRGAADLLSSRGATDVLVCSKEDIECQTAAHNELNDLHSTISPHIQKTAESIAHNYKHFLEQNGATQVAVAVIDNTDRSVVALIGSSDYWDEQNEGQNLGFWASRSPGSTLKPFLYALALEKGIISTDMLIEDAPIQFNGFRPLNFYENWQGLIKAEDALSQSLNVPFVHILQRTGVSSFLDILDKAELNYDKTIPYGLSVITGSIDIKLLELTNLYVTLARSGMHGNFKIMQNDKVEEYRLFSPGAITLTKNALSIRKRPDAPNLRDFIQFPKTVYWKTGTSFGRRDAWSIGWIDNYTVGVWAGNFDGTPSENIVGANLSAPIMFDILQALSRIKKQPLPAYQPRDLIKVKVCEFSGYRPSPFCPSTKYIYALASAVPQKKCPFHKKFIVEKNTGNLACPTKHYETGQLEEKSFIALPPQVAQILNQPMNKQPTLASDCPSINASTTLQIIFPNDGATYVLTPGIKSSGRIPLQAYSSSPENSIDWFVNGRHIGNTRSGESLLFDPSPGSADIVAIDSEGAQTRISIFIGGVEPGH